MVDLPEPELADERERLAVTDLERHVGHRLEKLLLLEVDHPVEPGRRHVERLRQVVDLDDDIVAPGLGLRGRGRGDLAHAGSFAAAWVSASGACSQHATRE